MTIKELAELLSEQGYNIKLRKRSDGGYIISKIDGVSFHGASGNIRARQIAGATLSHARAFQLERIRPPKFKSPMSRKKEPLPKSLTSKLRKIQREWRKKHQDIGGTISIRGLRYQYEQYGEEEALASLDKAYRYSQGYAYLENVQWLIERLSNLANKLSDREQDIVTRIIDKIKQKQMFFKEEWIHEIYQEIYEAEKHSIEVDELERRIDAIML